MELVKTGKTKDVYKLPDGNFLLKFKDTVTGLPSGEMDPGGNIVVGSVAGVGQGAFKMSRHYFELLEKSGVYSHYLGSDPAKSEMIVRPALPFGKGLEFVVRYKAVGSFVRRYGLYCAEGDALPKVFEVTLKDDEHDDPPATKETLAALNLLTPAQFDEIRVAAIKVSDIVKNDLASRGLELIDIKTEFGMVNGKIALIDDFGAGNMRVYKDGKKLDYLGLSALVS